MAVFRYSSAYPIPPPRPPSRTRADPVRLVSEALDADAEITTDSTSSNSNDPAAGHVQWIPIGDNQPGPCEAGLVLMAAHLNKGEPFYNLVDDSPRDSQGKSDKGLVVGDTVDFVLEDDTVCRYSVVMMWVSYGGPDANEWKPNGGNRRNNAVVFSELLSCDASDF